MAEGEPLNDQDRAPWLQAINDAAFAMQRTTKSLYHRLFFVEEKLSRYPDVKVIETLNLSI